MDDHESIDTHVGTLSESLVNGNDSAPTGNGEPVGSTN